MRRLYFTILVLLAISFVGLGHWYVAESLSPQGVVSRGWRLATMALLGLLGIVMVLQPILERRLPRRIAVFINWPAYIWMGAGFLLVVALGVSDLTQLALRYWLGSDHWIWEAAWTSHPIRTAWVLGIVGAGSILAIFNGIRFPKVKNVNVNLKAWPKALDGFRVVQLSDIHIGPMYGRRYTKRLVSLANELNPDLIVITGDAIDGTVDKVGAEVLPFANLKASLGVYYVTGNHEHYYGPGQWCDHFQSLGLNVLRNQCEKLEYKGSVLQLAGCYDYRGAMDEYKEDQKQALGSRDPNLPTIFLAHDPSSFPEAAGFGVDLQLSGHTHGGQIWPFHYLVRLAIPFVAGIYKKDKSTLYVSRGTGFWGPPMRLGAPQEVTLIKCFSQART